MMRSLHAAVLLLILAITQTEELPLATLVRFRAGWRGNEQIDRTSTSGAICPYNVSTLSELLRKAAAGSEDEAGAEQVG